jgi:mRNA interferase MazF
VNLLRGRAYAATIDPQVGRKYYLVVSNNRRNAALHTALAARLTTSVKPALASIVETVAADPLAGRVLCDDLVELWEDEVHEDLGALSRPTMRAVDAGLKAALGLP